MRQDIIGLFRRFGKIRCEAGAALIVFFAMSGIDIGAGSSARLTRASAASTLNCMEVKITPDLEAKLARLATERGRDTQALVQEAIEKLVDYDEWFLREVEDGLAAADRGELIDHEDVGKLINRRYRG
jgi:predicted transcriptional regulator